VFVLLLFCFGFFCLFVFSGLTVKPRASHMLGKCPATELHP
jgi:hypothetical protein